MGIWSKISAGLVALTGVLWALLGMEKSKRKAAELEANIEKSNRKTLEKERDIISNIDEEREQWDSKQSEEAIYNAQFTESLKNNDDDNAVTDGIIGMLNKNNSKDKAD